MWNKLILIFLAGVFSLSLYAQSSRYGRRRNSQNSRQSSSVKEQKNDMSAKKQTSKKNASQKGPSGFNPQKPALTQSQINYVMNGQIRKKLLDYKISSKLPTQKGDDEDNPKDEEKKDDGTKTGNFAFIPLLDFSVLISRYKTLIANFELTEVSGIRLEWYQKYLTELQKFEPFINEMEFAVRSDSSGRYAAAVQKFKEHQKACLKFLKEKPPRISKEQYQALLLKNTKIRQQNYLKKLQAEREAAMKRRQEELKQLQQKNQQNQKPAQGGAK